MKKLVAAGAVSLALLGGSAVAVRQATDSDATCVKPVSLFTSEQEKSIAVLEAYIEQNVAASFKHPEQLNWGSDDYNPVLEPGKIAARIMVMEGATMSPARYFHVTLVRDCQGGEWKVVEFKPLKT